MAAPLLHAASHEVSGLDIDLYAGSDFGGEFEPVPQNRRDLRDLTLADMEGFDAVVHLAALIIDYCFCPLDDRPSFHRPFVITSSAGTSPSIQFLPLETE